VIEVRSVKELAVRLVEQPASLGLVEVHAGNLAEILAWLREAQRVHPQARFVALLDRSLATQDAAWQPELAGKPPDVVSALLESGAIDVAESPRHLHNLLAISERHRAIAAIDSAPSARDGSLAEWAKSLLPWQDR
jgi:hypothetical protein